MPALFITGTGTGVGKTFVACALIRALRERGRVVDAFKPVVSGFDPADWADSDPGQLLRALGRTPDAAALEAMSPWRYAAPLSPDMAAAREGRMIDFDAVAALCRRRLAEAGERVLLIEGVGGVMSPVSRAATNLDLIIALDIPVVMIAGRYLGTISHTLTAIAALRARGQAPRAVVISESEPDGPPLDETAASIARLAPGVAVIQAGGETAGWETRVLDVAV